MTKLWQQSMLLLTLCFLSVFHQVVLANNSNSVSSKQHVRCHDDESLALFQFKQSFSTDESASVSPYAYAKVASWKQNEAGNGTIDDCCSWDGVECSEVTGHVIGLDLSSSFLDGSINSSSSLFVLVHLQSLDLSDNYFMQSQIPSEIGSLSQLTRLNLSFSGFSGQIPKEISQLTLLTSLDLSRNPQLQLQSLSFAHLIQSLRLLKELHLSTVNISSQIPHTLANLTSLRYLDLWKCGLTGEIPRGIFHLTKLTYLDLGNNEFKGHIPSSASLSELWGIGLGDIEFDGGILPNWFGKLTKLTYIDLSNTNLYGRMPSFLSNLSQLTHLDLRSNHIYGPIPSWLTNLTQLTFLDFYNNTLQGPIPASFSKLKHIYALDLTGNYLGGIVEADVFLNLKKLQYLELSDNNITFIDSRNYTNTTLPQFQVLSLLTCNLNTFPNFLRNQNQLQFLTLSTNYIRGQIPEWFLNCSKETLQALDLSDNLLTGFKKHPLILPWVGARMVGLGWNMLQGSLPVPPPNTMVYRVEQNRLTGEIPLLICQVSSLRTLDLSHNNMTGVVPPCLGNKITSLSILMLQGNKFRGTVPNSFERESQLELINISENQLEGPLPRSLANCSRLQFVNFADNNVDDNFPFWLGFLSELRILILRSNRFHGEIKSSLPISSDQFPKLRILDLSYNYFDGYLPQDYMIRGWPSMKTSEYNASYLEEFSEIELRNHQTSTEHFDFSISITNRGVKREYEKVWNVFTVLDLSSNRFEGEIPAAIGQLQGLQLLNLSNNYLTGSIPSSFANLTKLESLDISRNSLSGKIPPQFSLLTSLAFLNVSQNNLIGPIPQGNQMLTFMNTSYEGNLALCGEPLSKKCGNQHVPQMNAPRNEEDEESLFPTHAIDWIIISLGLASGLIVGLVFGNYLADRHHHWFVRKFGHIRLFK